MSHTVQSARCREGDEREAVRRSVDQAFPVVAAFLADEREREHVDGAHVTVMRGDVPAAAVPRTVVVPLLDTPGATLTVTCPGWCASDHRQEIERGVLTADFMHHGASEDLVLEVEDQPILSVRIEQRPFADGHREPVAATRPEAGRNDGDLTPQELCALADQLRAFAENLEDLAADVADARRGGRGESR
ncbi:hypothetical protein AB5J52_14065 [Streptomyces sp. R39]|uniref:Uncharacterized protein n=1 Tax=Streptomyces sp. R39 TaxID=3238631 RepID=A0AB39QKN0_9ACTN